MSDNEERSAAFYYVCGHQASNTPCPVCQPGQATQPDNWTDTYVSSSQPGTSDHIV